MAEALRKRAQAREAELVACACVSDRRARSCSTCETTDAPASRARAGRAWASGCAAVEALQRGALVEFGRDGGDWQVRLVVPLEDDRRNEP
jgi:hypothetical protein